MSSVAGFELRVVMTGLIVFVRNHAAGRTRLCALLVDARQGRRALDRTVLREHQGVIKIPGSRPLELDRQRIFLKLVEEQPNPFGTPGFPLQGRGDRPTEPASGQEDSFHWVLEMSRVFSRFDLDPVLLRRTPPARTVLAQFLIDRGEIVTRRLASERRRTIWRYRHTLDIPDGAFQQVFAHEVELILRNLRSASLVLVPFADGPRIERSLVPHGGRIEIRIENTCECDLPRDQPEPDVDSKWYFELMSAPRKEQALDIMRIRNIDLPIPEPILHLPRADADGIWSAREKPQESPGSGNCLKVRAADMDLSDLDELWPADV
jgi:hypothetical protein